MLHRMSKPQDIRDISTLEMLVTSSSSTSLLIWRQQLLFAHMQVLSAVVRHFTRGMAPVTMSCKAKTPAEAWGVTNGEVCAFFVFQIISYSVSAPGHGVRHQELQGPDARGLGLHQRQGEQNIHISCLVIT